MWSELVHLKLLQPFQSIASRVPRSHNIEFVSAIVNRGYLLREPLIP